VLSRLDMPTYVHLALTSRANGHVLKSADPQQLLDAVQRVAAGQGYVQPSRGRRSPSGRLDWPQPKQRRPRGALLATGPRCKAQRFGFPAGLHSRGFPVRWPDRATTVHVGRVIALQEDIGLDLLVHGEPERDDMVRHFAERLVGFALPESGWVQSYGSRCVRPPILIGDIWRPQAMTVAWTTYAASLTDRPVKAMLTGPVTMLRWSFVRDDQPPADTAAQLALAIADEVTDLEAAGVRVIQIDEPGLREGLPLQAAERNTYLAWATRAFQLAVAPAGEATQIHTHMCYADFSDVVDALGELDVDVISLEAARSGMAAIRVLTQSCYAGGVGPGIYDVHSPLVPSIDELAALLRYAVGALGADRVWANPDCGLKTRSYDEVVPALRHLVAAARRVRDEE
jgi:5-methyltetrahydropteroyltriglutamate--homocysteine methyltransferase